MSVQQLLAKKRDGGEFTREEIHAFIQGVTDGSIPDYQASAMLMAICIRGMTYRETYDMTMEMAASGETLDLSGIPGVKADKHSTGGVGDTTSLILTPLVAACGLKVAKMSGRGLDFTGGTLDKLESVPGLCVDMETDAFMKTVKTVGCAIIGQTKALAPADKVLYALRDVTSTVDSLPLIASSVLSKKLASGADAIVLDVKTGSGAIKKTLNASMQLARVMVDIGKQAGRKFSALVTDMNQPLGTHIGNALEVKEAIAILSGHAEGDLKTVSIALGAHMLLLAGVVTNAQAGEEMLLEKLASGEGLRKLGEMFKAEGGDARVIYDPSLLPHAPVRESVCAQRDGYVSAIHTQAIGYAAKALGAGRTVIGETIDLSVGMVIQKRVGDYVRKGDVLCEMHISPVSRTDEARALLDTAFELTSDAPIKPTLIYGVVE